MILVHGRQSGRASTIGNLGLEAVHGSVATAQLGSAPLG
jgi:hypothetical protein